MVQLDESDEEDEEDEEEGKGPFKLSKWEIMDKEEKMGKSKEIS